MEECGCYSCVCPEEEVFMGGGAGGRKILGQYMMEDPNNYACLPCDYLPPTLCDFCDEPDRRRELLAELAPEESLDTSQCACGVCRCVTAGIDVLATTTTATTSTSTTMPLLPLTKSPRLVRLGVRKRGERERERGWESNEAPDVASSLSVGVVAVAVAVVR